MAINDHSKAWGWAKQLFHKLLSCWQWNILQLKLIVKYWDNTYCSFLNTPRNPLVLPHTVSGRFRPGAAQSHMLHPGYLVVNAKSLLFLVAAKRTAMCLQRLTFFCQIFLLTVRRVLTCTSAYGNSTNRSHFSVTKFNTVLNPLCAMSVVISTCMLLYLVSYAHCTCNRTA